MSVFYFRNGVDKDCSHEEYEPRILFEIDPDSLKAKKPIPFLKRFFP